MHSGISLNNVYKRTTNQPTKRTQRKHQELANIKRKGQDEIDPLPETKTRTPNFSGEDFLLFSAHTSFKIK